MAFRFYPEVDTYYIAVPFWNDMKGHWGRKITVGRIWGGVHIVMSMHFVWYQKDQMSLYTGAWTVASDLPEWPGTWKYDWKIGVKNVWGRAMRV